MRELLSRKDLTESLYVLDSDYFINIDEAVKSLFQARTIIRKYLKTNEIKDRSLLNNVIIVNNILGVKRTNFAFYNTFTDIEFSYIKSALIFANIYDNDFGTDVDHDAPIYLLFEDCLRRAMS